MIVVGIYNKLVTLKNRFENAFSQIEVQLQRRYDLIPNLIETVKGYMAHEKETLEAVIQARNQAQSSLQAASQNPGDASAIAGLAGAEGLLGGALGRIFALSESYPDLKANQNMANLQEELSSTENKVAFSRQAFNDAVTSYNTYKGEHKLGGTPLRKNFAGVGFIYDKQRDAFYQPQPYASWKLDEETCHWEAPTPMPTDGKAYKWNEENLTWDVIE